MRRSRKSSTWSFFKQLTTGSCDCGQVRKMVRFSNPLVTEIHLKEDAPLSAEIKKGMWYSKQDIRDFRAKKGSSTEFDELTEDIQECMEELCWCLFEENSDSFYGQKNQLQNGKNFSNI